MITIELYGLAVSVLDGELANAILAAMLSKAEFLDGNAKRLKACVCKTLKLTWAMYLSHFLAFPDCLSPPKYPLGSTRGKSLEPSVPR